MKKLYINAGISLFLSLFINNSRAQVIQNLQTGKHLHNHEEPCGFDRIHQHEMATNPVYQQLFHQANEIIYNASLQNSGNRTMEVYTIPVVVHVLHTGVAVGNTNNISDAQIQSAITALNNDFRYISGTPGGANANGVDTYIEFCLAQRDPNCNPTNGIVRVNASSVPNYTQNGMSLQGGAGAPEATLKNLSRWPNSDYYNIWIVNKINGSDQSGVQGFAYLPNAGTASNTNDGAVILFNAFGTTGNLKPFTNMNRTATHELGHGLNLLHTFEGASCTQTNCNTQGDLVCDTPPTVQNTQCSSTCAGANFRNYMDYTPQNCMNMFTEGQRTRMRLAIEQFRPGLITSLGCVAPGAIAPPTAASCSPNTTNPNANQGIRRVKLHTLNYVSGSSLADGGYLDKTCSQAVELIPGQTYPLEVQSNVNPQRVKVYIDFNDNGVFTDPGEMVFNSNTTGAATHTSNITMPTNPITNKYIRMRVVSDWNATPTGPCYTPNVGQVEDYSVYFVDQGNSPVAEFTASQTSVCVGNTINFTDQSTGNPTSWQWTFPGGTPATSTSQNPSVVYSTPGTYNVTLVATNSDGSDTELKTNFITIHPNPTVTANVTNAACLGVNTGSINLTTSGGSGFTYLWTPGGMTTANIGNLATGDYTVQVTNSNSCVTNETFTVGQQTNLNLTLTAVNEFCGDGLGQITAIPSGGTQPYTYQWTPGNLSTSSINNLTEGLYTVLVTDANNCSIQDTISVINENVQITGPQGAICEGQSTNLTAFALFGGNLTYSWSSGQSTASINVTPLINTDYTVTVTSGALSCSETFSVDVITVNANILTPSGTTACIGSAVPLQANQGPGYTYQWRLNGVDIPGATSLNYNATQSGLYSVAVSGTQSCTIISDEVSVTINNGNVVSITSSGSTSICDGQSVNLIYDNPSNFPVQWQFNGNNIVGATDNVYSASQAGSYSVIVQDGGSCPATSNSINVLVNNLPSDQVNVIGNTSLCAGQTTTLQAENTPGNTFQWFKNGVLIPSATNSIFTVNESGVYNVVVTNIANCSQTSQSINITVNPVPTVSITANGPTTFCQGSSVTLVGSASANSTLQWLLNGNPIVGQTNSTLIVSQAGNYSLQVTDANNCIGFSNTITTQFGGGPTANITANGSTNICLGSSVILNANAGAGFSYQWFQNGNPIQGQTGSSFTATESGNYTVVVTDASGCFNQSNSLTVNASPLSTPLINVNGSTSLCQGASVGLSTSFNPQFLYQWFLNGTAIPGATQNTFSANQQGVYSVNVTNPEGCVAASNGVIITIANSPAATVTPNGNINICEGQSITLLANQGAGFTYQWFLNGVAIPNSNSISYIASTSGNYSVQITNPQNCSATSANVTVSVTWNPPAPFITVNGSVLTSSSPSGNQWYLDGVAILGATNQTYVASTTGTYTVTVIQNGCESEPSDAVDFKVGLEIWNTENLFNIYPNPNDGVFNISFTSPQNSGMFYLQIFSVTGALVYDSQFPIFDYSNTLGINLGHLSEGTYYVKTLFNEMIKTEKLVILKK